MKLPMGVYIVRNLKNNRVFVDVSKDTKSTFNRLRFQLKAGCHRIKALQKDWMEYGEEGFAIEVLEYLEYDEKDEKNDYSEELEILKLIWLDKLNQEGPLEYYEK